MCGNTDQYDGFDLVARDAVVACKTYEDWSAEWWKWATYAPNGESPAYDDDSGVYATVDNDGPVFFIAGTGSGTGAVVREFDVPADTPVFFPVVNAFAVTWPPDPPDYVETTLDDFELQMKGMHASIDGQEIANVEDFLVRNDDFTVAAPKGSNLYELIAASGLPPELDPGDEFASGSTGYWLMLKNLAPGEHTIEFGGWFDANKNGVFEPDKDDTEVDVTANINVTDEAIMVDDIAATAAEPAPASLDLLV
jgi:hypothetical protein